MRRCLIPQHFPAPQRLLPAPTPGLSRLAQPLSAARLP